jgi:hypothetical protein
VEKRRVTCSERQEGQDMLAASADRTRDSNWWSQPLQRNSKIGMAASFK